MTIMGGILVKTMEEVERLLKVMKAEYLIKMPDGKTYGTLKEAEVPKKNKRKSPKYDLHEHYLPFLENVAVGDVVVVPHIKGSSLNEQRRLYGAVTARCSTKWGLDSYKSCRTKTGVEILRTA